MKYTILVVVIGVMVFCIAIVGVTLQVDRVLRKSHAQQHVTCYPSSPAAVQGKSGPEYLPLFAFDAVDAPDLSSDSDVVLANGSVVRIHLGGATCFSLPVSVSQAPAPSSPLPPVVHEPDAGPVK